MEVEACPEDDRCREREREPLPAVELKRGDHGKNDERRRESGRDDEALSNRVRAIRGAGRLARQCRVVAGCFDRTEQIGYGHAPRVEPYRRLLGRVVDGRLDAVELVELALDAVCARSAGHPFEREIDPSLALGCLDGGHAASYPASMIAARSAASSRSCP